LVLPPWVLEDILDPLRRVWPEEGCGLLAGHRGPDGLWVVETAEPTANVASSDRRKERFEVDAAARIAFERRLRGSPLRIIGHYHSHPGSPPAPSATDRRLAFEPDLLWVLVGLKTADDPLPVVAAWAVDGWSAADGASGFRWVPLRDDLPERA